MRHSEPTLIPSQPNFERRSRIATRRSCAPLPKQNRHGFPNDGANSLPNAPKWLLKPRQLCQQNQCFEYGWGGRDRTSEWRNQNPLPYRLATPQQATRGTAEAPATADSHLSQPVYRERRGISTAWRGKIPQARAWWHDTLYYGRRDGPVPGRRRPGH